MTYYRLHAIQLLKKLTSSTPFNVFVLFYLIEKTLWLGNYHNPSKYDWINNLQYFVFHYFLYYKNEHILLALSLLAFMFANKAFTIKINSFQSLKQLFLIGIFTSLQWEILLTIDGMMHALVAIVYAPFSNEIFPLQEIMEVIAGLAAMLFAVFSYFLAFYIIGNFIRGAYRLCFTSELL